MGRGGYSSILSKGGPGNITVAPIVAWNNVGDYCSGGVQGFTPANTNLRWGNTYNGQVTFDTAMDTSQDPLKVVTTNGGCQSTILTATWDNPRTIKFRLQVKQQGYLRLTVHNDLARSGANQVRLDGNLLPSTGDNGMGPNQDDYVADNSCDPVPSAVPATQSVTPAAAAGAAGLRVQDAFLAVAPGSEEAGAITLENRGAADLAGVSLIAAALISGTGEIPASAIRFAEPAVDLPAGSSRTVYFYARLPRNLANGSYSGPVASVMGGQPTGVQGKITLVVNRPPSLRAEGPRVLHAGDPAQFRIRPREAHADPIVLSANLPVGASLTDAGDGTWLLSFDDTSRMQGAYSIQIWANYNLPGVARPPQSLLAFRVLVGPARPAVISVSDANFGEQAVAPGSLASAFPGNGVLAGDHPKAEVIDADGTVRPVALVAARGGRWRYQVPADASPGIATLRISSDSGFATGTLKIRASAPAIYTGEADDPQAIGIVPEDGSVILTLPGTGLRSLGGTLKVTVGGVEAEVLSVGAHPGLQGLDDLRLRLPKEALDRDQVPVTLTVDGLPVASARIALP
jgi:uncharacterized protein (TIGR03437 family)